MRTTSYVPDHIRLNRTDRLWHIRESLQMTMARLLPDYWNNQQAAASIQRLQREISLISTELQYRTGRGRIGLKNQTPPRYNQQAR